jgi:predicted GIY-YIG superfamily endonuclease
MIEIIKPLRYWTYEKCKEAALKYNTKKEFRKNSSSAYNVILVKNWNNLLSHMKIIGNRYNKCIYVYEFPDNHAYIGLTYNINKRNLEHLSCIKSPVYKHLKNVNLNPKLIKLTEYIPVKNAIEQENYWVNKYKDENWIILNKIKTGAVGSGIEILTKEYCSNFAKLCKSRYDFCIKYNGPYRKALKNNWMDEFFPKKISEILTKDYCSNFAKLCKSRYDFSIKYFKLYVKSLKNCWLDEFFPINNLTKEYCYNFAKTCKSKTDFHNKYQKLHYKSLKNGWIDEFFPIEKITKEYCYNLSKSCKSRSDFYKKYQKLYTKSLKNGWIDEFFPIDKITKDDCFNFTKKCKSRYDFYKKNQKLYVKSLKNNWLDEFFTIK